ncbi:Uncharacterized protein FWK35_00024968 [Aphis craccivora]|uniref:Uncharacterized protein n=1 Tax=Aphis craccivora TaxID=307492 RepID=A0A6G0W118_APHCR|nr:Uncharacterized protein FWK35_00024968 [Aphis craccivora]
MECKTNIWEIPDKELTCARIEGWYAEDGVGLWLLGWLGAVVFSFGLSKFLEVRRHWLVLISKIQEQFNLNILNCPIHSEHFENKILNFSIKLLINHWCVEVNRILNGKKKINCNEKDNIKIAAANSIIINI